MTAPKPTAAFGTSNGRQSATSNNSASRATPSSGQSLDARIRAARTSGLAAGDEARSLPGRRMLGKCDQLIQPLQAATLGADSRHIGLFWRGEAEAD